jgi:hypothetical protein
MRTTILLLLSFLITTTSFAIQRTAEIVAHEGENLRTLEVIDGEEVLTILRKLPKGTKFKFRTNKSLIRPLIQNKQGDIFRSRSHFLGSIVILEASGITSDQLKELNRKKLFLYQKSTALAKVTIEARSSKGALFGTLVNDSSIDPEVSRYLKLNNLRLPKGSIVSLRPDQYLSFPHYLDKGKLKKSGARYFGPIKIVSAPGLTNEQIRNFNKKDLYTYEWHYNKLNIIKAMYDTPLPSGENWINDSFLWDRENPSRGWSYYTANFILSNATELLQDPPSDIEDFCPAYNDISDQKKSIFWVHLMNAIAKKESLFDPGVMNDESGFGPNGNEVISRGLLQISLSSSRNRNYQRLGCPVETTADLHDPTKNLQCGVAIFNHLTNDYNCISCKYPQGHSKAGKFAGISRYWSTLRTPYEVSCRSCSSGKVKLGFRNEIIKKTKDTHICKKTP